MKASSKKALKSGVWYTICNFVVKGAGFLTTPIFTRILSQNDVGAFANMLSWVGILMIVTTFELFGTVGLARFDFKDELDDYMASNLVFGSTITLAFYTVCLIFKDAALNFLSFSELEFHVAFLYLMVYPALAMLQGRKQIMYQYKTSVILSLSSMLTAILTSLTMVLLLSEEHKLTGRIVGYYTPMILMNLGIYIYILSKAKHIRLKYFKYAIRLSLPMMVHLVASNLLNTSDRVMIRSMSGTSAAALYTVAYQAAIVVNVLWHSMNSAWSPWAYEMMNKEEYGALRKASKPYVLGFGFVALCFLLVGPELLWIMGGSGYMPAVGVIPPVLCAFVFQFVYSLYVNVEYYYKKQKYIAAGTIIASSTNIVLNYLFIPVYGYIAAAYTTLVGYALLFLVHYFLTTKVLKKDNIFDARFLFLFLFADLAIMFLGLILYEYTLIRYAIIVCIAVVVLTAAFIFRQELVAFIKTRSMKGFKQKYAALKASARRQS